jgi:hypothetical protein
MSLPLDRQATLELEDAAHDLEHKRVGLSLECFEHADEVAGRGHRGTDAVSEWFTVGAEA